jgi:hypothetical protein
MPDNDLTPVDDELRKLVMGHLPPLSEAIRLCDIYLDWGKTLSEYLVLAVMKELTNLTDGIRCHATSYSMVYWKASIAQSEWFERHLLREIIISLHRSYESIPGPHDLSLLFSVFSLAALFDFDRPAYSVEAYEYYILSHVALNFSCACTDTTLHTVHAVVCGTRTLGNCDAHARYSYISCNT